jgi:hypothetical protein
MQVNTVNVELSIAKSHYVGYMHVTIYKTQLQCQNLNYLTLKSSIQNEWTLHISITYFFFSFFEEYYDRQLFTHFLFIYLEYFL